MRRLALSLALLLALPAWARAQATPAAVEAETAAVGELVTRALAEFDGPQQSRSIALFDEAIERLETQRRLALLTDAGRELLVTCYEHRGRAYFGIGLQDKAAESFRALVQVRPQHVISKERVSPKVVALFDSVKQELVGFLAVSSRPAGARVSLNGRFLALTDFFPVEVLAGTYTVEIAREGYASDTREVTIVPQATETLQADLVRTTASFFFVTEPAGVEIWIDGQLRGSTSGALAPDLHETARAAGLDPARASGRLEVTGIAVGTRQIELRRRCYEPVRRALDVTEPSDFEVPPFRLEDSVGSLQLTSDPPGGLIYLDGEPMGQTPREIERVCSGKHRLEVKHPSGKFLQDVVIGRNEVVSLDCPIRPSLAFLGTVAEGPGGERVLADADEKLGQLLSKIRTLNFVPASRDLVTRVLEGDGLTARGLVPGQGTEPDVLRRVGEKLAAALEVQGFLIAWLPEERLQRTAVLHLLAAGNTVSDTWSLAFSEPTSFIPFITAVDQKATVFRSWSGLITVDTELHQGVPVLRIVPGSPAAFSGILPGEAIYAADGAPIAGTAELLRVVETKKPRDKLALQVRGPEGARALELTLGETPQEVPLNEPRLLYNKVMMDLRQQVQGYPGSEPAAYARLNLGICALHFGDFAAAHEHFLKARAELPARPGVSRGTAVYYLGLALERLGLQREAAEAYKAASGFVDATLFNNDGPALAPLAARRAAGRQ
ncbi:MAG: PEGA domain-containing protein [Vicinamibacteria bacterium]